MHADLFEGHVLMFTLERSLMCVGQDMNGGLPTFDGFPAK